MYIPIYSAAADRSARALNRSAVLSRIANRAVVKDERSKLGRDGPVVSISTGRGRGAKKYTNG